MHHYVLHSAKLNLCRAECVVLLTYYLVDGMWSEWNEITECSQTCNDNNGGTQLVERRCNFPSPKYGGKDCPRETGAPLVDRKAQSCNKDEPCSKI